MFFILYSLFFLLGGLIAPVLAHFKFFEQADSVYLLFHRSCHQDAIRCFWILGYQTALCARCLGVYIGVIVFLISYLFNFRSNKYLFAGVTVLAFGEILIEVFKISESNNYIRFFAGICLGIFLAIILTKFLYRNKTNTERECDV